MRKTAWIFLVPAALLVLAGCGADPAVKQVHELRLSGQLDSARALALSLLTERANRMPLWQEFARTSAEISRMSDDPNEPDISEICMQAALLCAAIHQKPKSENRLWRETGRLISAEVGRQLNGVMSAYSTQAQTAAMLKQIKEQTQGQDIRSGEMMRMEELVQSYRDDARKILTLSVIWRQLLAMLPELNPGISSMYGAEMEQRQNDWIEALQLETGYTAPIQKRAHERLDKAMARLQEDLSDLGFFLVSSVTENGVLP